MDEYFPNLVPGPVTPNRSTSATVLLYCPELEGPRPRRRLVRKDGGSAPDIEIEADLGAFGNGHGPVLASALASLRGGAVERGATRHPGRIPPRP